MLAVALLLVVQLSDTTPARAAPRYTAVRDSLEAAELRFFWLWGEAYRASATDIEHWSSLRGVMRSCPWPAATRVDSVMRRRAHMVGDSSDGRCPVWMLDTTVRSDEARGIDNALASRFHAPVRTDRARLLARFDSAAARYPDDEWIAGQRVRLLIDQQQYDAALAVSTVCSADHWWCWALRGYAHYHLGQLPASDAAYQEAVARMPQSIRCEWSDITPLLTLEERRQVQSNGCTAHLALARDFWWLADPLWTDTINERRVEHFARMTTIQLRRALDHDERWAWSAERGGHALAEMVLRYGWPNYITWGGEAIDDALSARVLIEGGRANSPYTAFEYVPHVPPRVHFVPTLRALRAPFAAELSDWSLSPSTPELPRNLPASAIAEPSGGFAGGVSVATASDFVARQWWPGEHMPFRVEMRELEAPAVVHLRRQHAGILAVASDASRSRLEVHEAANAYRATLTWSDGADRAVIRDSVRQFRAGQVAWVAEIPPAPALIELAIEGTAGRAVGRARFAVSPPPPLATMGPGEKAISDIVLLEPEELPVETTPTPQLLRGLRASQSVLSGNRVRLYWETYGYAPADTLEVALGIRRIDEPSALRRLAITFQLASDPNQPMAISWQRSHANVGAALNPGGVPVIPHAVVINLERLGAGDYEIVVAVRKPGDQEVTASRTVRRVP